ncbi:ABC-2 type transport system permease protein [Mucilaginibacter gracilis]|uniref:ABC-2 type transport system permease protein n=1 Tax=Mucilaginibacter gracilis TaxID=423350 RepID=A0A495J5I4_9SPHI|nr:Gldg family protein [Mucilaginibacter gracilis]RKR83981.1 ABC-2 type transport system permease protein [Mucilaginibacter gracilis]
MKKVSNNLLPNSHWEEKQIVWRIALTELQSLFYSPIAWVILIAFTLQLALTYTGQLGGLIQGQIDTGVGQSELTSRILGQGVFGLVSVYGGVLDNLFLYIPLITMGLLSNELQSGSIKLLYSSPVKNYQIILGKFLSMMIYGLVLLFIIFVFVIWTGFVVKDFGWAHALTAMVGAYLLICTFSAIGLFMSSVTSYQEIAAISTLAALTFFTLVNKVGQDIDFIRDVTYWFSIAGRAESFVRGMLCSEDVIYFVVIILLFLSLSIIKLNAVRQQNSWKASLWKYIAVIVLSSGVGYLSSRPQLMSYYDATQTKTNTITLNSQEILKNLKGGLTITTFVNILDDISVAGMPQNRKGDMENFRQFIRFKPDIRMKYVYYYADGGNLELKKKYPGLNARKILEKVCLVEDLDPNDYSTAEEVERKYHVDLKSEYYRMVRLVERDSGERTYLRMFDMPDPQPRETEISAAFKRLTMKSPVVGFLQGHGERKFNQQGDLSYRRISTDKVYRYSLINNGFDFQLVYLDKEIPKDVDLLVIAEMRTSLSSDEQKRLNTFIARGGNLFILGDIRRQKVMNPVIEQFGVQFRPGQLVQLSENGIPPNFIVSFPTDEAIALSYPYKPFGSKRGIGMSGSLGIKFIADSGYKTIPFYLTDNKTVWNELKPVNYEDETPVIDSVAGERTGLYATVVGLTRMVKGTQQRILISGDADCISNGGINFYPKGLPIFNDRLANGSFFWLSGNKMPVDTRRPKTTDNDIHLGTTGFNITKIFLVWVLPGLMLVAGIVIFLKRRGR